MKKRDSKRAKSAMTFAERRNVTASDQVAEAVEKIDLLIGSGKLIPGQRLIEAELIGQLEIGRMPIREALRILAGDGIVELVPNRGARIRTLDSSQIGDMLRVLLALVGVGIEESIEGPSFAQLVIRLKALTDDINRWIITRDGRRLLTAMAQYHELIMDASHNDYLRDSSRRVHFHHYNRHVLDAVEFDVIAIAAKEYDGITEAIGAKQTEKAIRLYRKSVDGFIAALKRK